MIGLDKDSEYTLFIKDFIETLSKTEKFVLKVWVSGSELPYIYDESHHFYFMEGGFRVMDNHYIDYHFYDTITGLRIIYKGE